MPVKPIPDGYHTITPFLKVKGAATLIDFLKSAFDATNIEMMNQPDGTIMHAELKIGNSIVMLADAPDGHEAMPAMLYLYVPDTDATYKRAIDAGGISLTPPANQFYGDRNASIQDPTGNKWYIATHVEDVSGEEMARRMKERK